MQFRHLFTSLMLGIFFLAALTLAPAAADTDTPLCPCPRNYDPVCAANLITYANRCEYDCVRRDVERRGRSLNLLRSGPC
ncbi:serine protease inhibitor Kazal-type 1 [Anastrepha ludens]|uniref:serine protease inhibitor Kazal-type 1 n=1 Tax=Anastrepha ludens TaxID=28586 RepID=UPI0023AF8ECA|nr:serine protease inhibitor Kazal-type 1 [Anastrepha ludens]